MEEIVSYMRAHKSIIHLCLNVCFHCVAIFPLIWLSNNHLNTLLFALLIMHLAYFLCFSHVYKLLYNILHSILTYFDFQYFSCEI
jgi:hypothetical protein